MRESVRSPRLLSSLRIAAIIFASCLTVIGIGACARSDANSGAVQFVIEPAAADAVRDLRFYIHDVQLLRAQGEAVPFDLIPDSVWQDDRVALVDLFGTSEADRHAVIRGAIDQDAAYDGIRFVVGVPFEYNHRDPLKAGAPLDKGDLFWTWQSGYKFLRVDLSDEGKETSFHLGSTGCASASAVRPPKQPCSQPNLMHVELRGFDPLHQPIQVRVSELIEAMRAPESGACTGGYAHEPACAHVFAKTGMNPNTGLCADGVCRDQKIFGSP